MDLVTLHRKGVAGFDSRVKAVAQGQWKNPTPCTEWNVRDLVNHIVYESVWTPDLLAGKTIEEVGDRYDGDLLGDDPQGAWDRASQEAVAAVQKVDDLDMMVNVSWGQIPAREYISQLTLDYTVHGWDLAMGTGGATEMDPDLLEFSWVYTTDRAELIAASGVFANPLDVPDDTPMQTRLLGLLGRKDDTPE